VIRREYLGFLPQRAAMGAGAIVLPVYILELGGLPSHVGFTLFMGSMGMLLGIIIWGRLSLGGMALRTLMVSGTVANSVLFLLLYAVPELTAIPFVYFAGNLFVAAVVPSFTRVVFDVNRRSEWDREQGRLNTLAGWSWTGGVFMALGLSAIADVGTLLVMCAVLNALSLPLLLATLRGRVARRPIRVYPVRRPYLERLRFTPLVMLFIPSITPPKNPHLRTFFVSVFLVFFVSGMVIPQAVIYARYLYGEKWWPYTVYAALTVASALWYTRVSNRLENEASGSVFYNGVLLRTLGIAVLAISPSMGLALLPTALIASLLLGISWSYISISNLSYLGRVAREHERKQALEFYNFVNGLALSIGNVAGGLITDIKGFNSTFLLAIILLTVGTIFMRRIEGHGPPRLI